MASPENLFNTAREVKGNRLMTFARSGLLKNVAMSCFTCADAMPSIVLNAAKTAAKIQLQTSTNWSVHIANA